MADDQIRMLGRVFSIWPDGPVCGRTTIAAAYD
jgi:hypothetical protein